MTAPNLTPAEALEVVRSTLSPSKECAGRMTYQVRGVEVTKEQCIDAIAKELDGYLQFSIEMHHRLKRMAPEAKGNTGALLDYVEEKLSEHEATKAKLAAYEDSVVDMNVCEVDQLFLNTGVLYRFRRMEGCDACASYGRKAKEPAAAVPSDEEIRKAIYMAKNMPQPSWTISAIELVCQRIGVKL